MARRKHRAVSHPTLGKLQPLSSDQNKSIQEKLRLLETTLRATSCLNRLTLVLRPVRHKARVASL
jgi:hypothetical protein